MQQFIGTIKSFKQGWGFIQCEATQQIYGKDIFLMSSHLEGDMVQQGDQVQFTVNPHGSKGPEAMPGVKVVYRAAGMQGGLGGEQLALAGHAGQPQGQYIGLVKIWNGPKGWGLIQSPETFPIYGKDMFFMQTVVIENMTIYVGLQVSFDVEQGTKGPEAANVQSHQDPPQMPPQQPQPQYATQAHMPQYVLPPGQQQYAAQAVAQLPQAQAGPPGQSYFGVIKSFSEEKGWGHISCDTTRALYGKDMFLLRGQLHGQSCQPGDQAMFTVQMGQKGPEATNVAILPQGQGAGGPPPLQAGQGQDGLGATFAGTVKMFDVEKGWGFIDCEGSRAIYQKDIFLRKCMLADSSQSVNVGDQVMFSVQMGQKGPEATGATILPQGQVAHMAAPALEPPEPVPGGQTFAGTIKMFDPDKGWGFVECESSKAIYQKDIFLHKRVFGDTIQAVNAGDQVMFSVHMGSKGPEAANVTILPQGGYGIGSGEPVGASFTGIVKMFDADKGWGFIECEESKAIYQKDIFLHKRVFSDVSQTVNAGDQVQFSVTLGGSGKPEAYQVTFVEGYRPISNHGFSSAAPRPAPY